MPPTDKLITPADRTSQADPEKLVIAVLMGRDGNVGELCRLLAGPFGTADRLYGPFPHSWTDYYRPEMGPDLRRLFYVCPGLKAPGGLAGDKRTCGRLESRFKGNGRRYNLDPGRLSLGRFVLASLKDAPHRIPLDDGVFAELTLVYQGGEYRALPWAYPDWASRPYRELLGRIRSRYKEERRQLAYADEG